MAVVVWWLHQECRLEGRLSIVLRFLLSTQLVLFKLEALNDENSSFGVTLSLFPGSVDVPEWAVGDLWTYDAFSMLKI